MKSGTFYPSYKNSISLLFLCSLFLPLSCRLGVVAWFCLNQPFIAQELCVNRFEPASSCEGSCYLDSMLQEVENEAGKVPEHLLNMQEVLLFYSEPTSLILLPLPQGCLKTPAYSRADRRTSTNVIGIFKPPRPGSCFLPGTSQAAGPFYLS